MDHFHLAKNKEIEIRLNFLSWIKPNLNLMSKIGFKSVNNDRFKSFLNFTVDWSFPTIFKN